MCYYLTSKLTGEEIFQLEHDYVVRWQEPDPTYYYTVSGFAHPKLPVITAKSEFTGLTWGLIPAWVKDWNAASKLRIQTLNAQSEGLEAKPSFRNAVKSGRLCVVPVNGYFEWHHHVNGKKYPYFIFPKTQSFFMLAGLYETWINKDTAEVFRTFTIITTPANERMAFIHNTKKRMPAILSRDDAKVWLDPKISFKEKKKLLQPFDQNEMLDHTVGKLITSRQENPNQPMVTEPFNYQELGPDLFS